MPTTAQIVRAWQNATHAHLAIRVPGEGPVINGTQADIEYVARVPLDQLAGLPLLQQRALLIEAVKQERAANLALAHPTDTDLPGLTGQVQV